MAKSDYNITKSNYTIRRHHMNVSGGTVSERDFMATLNLGGFDSGSIPYSENGFKIVRRLDTSLARKHEYGTWLRHDSGSEWQWKNALDFTSNEVSSENEIKIKPNYESLLDFAYFGSCYQLIKVTVLKIIENFPGALEFTDNDSIECGLEPTTVRVNQNGTTHTYNFKKIVENPFNIDIFTKLSYEIPSDANELRYFLLSLSKYKIYSETCESREDWCAITWDVYDNPNFKCIADGVWDKIAIIDYGIAVARFYYDGVPHLLWTGDNPAFMSETGESLRFIAPDESTVEEYFNSLSDFENVLLNRNTSPVFTARLDYIEDTDTGVKISKKNFTWPVMDDFNKNLDISSSEYEFYITSLLDLAESYDNHYCNNLIRMMTHDSIKNMDVTFLRRGSDEDSDDYAEGTTKLMGFLWACGRQLDEIKRQVDVVKSMTNVSYDEKNNIPDYFVSDSLQDSGWEVSSAVIGIDSEATTGPLYDGIDRTYDKNDANLLFMRELKLNSREILSRKGTRNGIEMLLSLFGLVSMDFVSDEDKSKGNYDYEIKEYTYVVSETPGAPKPENEEFDAEKYNSMKIHNETDNGEDGYYDSLEGLPVKMVYFEVTESGSTYVKKVIVPWFSNLYEIDGNPYFQMYGGWGKRMHKRLENSPTGKNAIETDEENGHIIYEETLKYINVVSQVGDLKKIDKSKLKENDVFYVCDISDIETYLTAYDTPSNYFILKDPESKLEYGGNGWLNISESDLRANNTGDSWYVAYLESIYDDGRGNNPHVGYGKYDEGKEYVDYFRRLFKYSIENDNFSNDAYDCETGEILDDIKNCGFKFLSKEEPSAEWTGGCFAESENHGLIYNESHYCRATESGFTEGNLYVWNGNAWVPGNTSSVKPELMMDNVKTWYFNTIDPMSETYLYIGGVNPYHERKDVEFGENAIDYSVEESDKDPEVNPKINVNPRETFFTTERLAPVKEADAGRPLVDKYEAKDLRGFTGNTVNSVYCADSVINVKNMSINFKRPALYDGDLCEYVDYINNSVKPYLLQMIPSTTVFEMTIEGEENCPIVV